MKTIRRRAASPALRWKAAGPKQQYRVIVRNQDTGEARIIYEGFRPECRLPPDLRLVSDQLAYRVMARLSDDPQSRFEQLHEYAPILRLGDDYRTPADDLLIGDVVAGAEQYRLVVRAPDLDRPLVDMVRPTARFLLPPGQLRDGQFEYDILARVRGGWRNRKGLPVTASMIAAADERADRLVPMPRERVKRAKGSPARHAPGSPDRLSAEAHETGPVLLVAVDVTARADLSPVASPHDVVSRQWWAGDGTGAVERVALALESNALKGLFFIDVLAGEALGDDRVAALGETLGLRGHGVALMVNPEPWRGFSQTLADMDDAAITEFAFSRYESILGRRPSILAFAPGALNDDTLARARRLGVRAILGDRGEDSGLTAWMRWRTRPFAAYDDLAIIPSTMALSTPVHAQDRVVRHTLNATDAMAADSADALVAAVAEATGNGPVIARIDSLSLLRRSMMRSSALAEDWNRTVAEHLPAWGEAGWVRSPHGFPVLADRDEIRVEMVTALIAGLGKAGLPNPDPRSLFTPENLRGWARTGGAFEPLIEQRRGPRKLRRSAVRRYDAAFLQALKATPA
ncbi:MAG: hypothetical protein ACK4FB_10005 [Brevundimonas sp.]|uniref:hypothetical protein n=1 Tax=Brevundimonas sp. TaxID=1871086 RepID=UPI00391BEB1A